MPAILNVSGRHSRRLISLLSAAVVLALVSLVSVVGIVTAIPAHAAAPTVTSFTPTAGAVGTAVTINGTGFAAPATVTFNGTSTAATVVSATRITAKVPARATTGILKVVTSGGSAGTATFTVQLGIALSISVGPPSTAVTINGSGFGANELVDLYAGVTDQALVVSDAGGTFSYPGFTIPSTAQPGTFWLTAAGRRTGLAAQAPFTVQSNWPERGYGLAHGGRNPTENTLSVNNVAELGLSWRFGTSSMIGDTPVVANGNVYAGGSSGIMYDLSASTGQVIWSHSYGDDAATTAAVSGSSLFFGTRNGASFGRFYALNSSTGASLWTFLPGANVESSPIVFNGVVYFGDDQGKLWALNAATGAVVWSHLTGGRIQSSPAIANGIVYFGSDDFNVYALNAANGALVWSYATGAGVDSSPVVANGVVLVGSYDHLLYAFNPIEGQLIWTFTTGGAIFSSPAAARGIVYFGSFDGTAYAVNIATGSLVWSYHTGSYDTASPALANGIIFFGSDNPKLWAFNAATGAMLWSYAYGTTFDAFAIADGRVFTGSPFGIVDSFGLPPGTAPGNVRPAAHQLHPNTAMPVTRAG